VNIDNNGFFEARSYARKRLHFNFESRLEVVLALRPGRFAGFATTACFSSSWWQRKPPMENYLAQRALDFGNDPDLVARTFVANDGSFSVTCRVCGLIPEFCEAGSEKRCYDRPSTGMDADRYGTGPGWHYFCQEVRDGRVDADFSP
jgi:hypothetical protein